ncbi:uncharacterized protein LOC127277730 [Leptopilina boulardi]|uniref:uncharacterized protein LOC127277730 n=1 Tax=Leptopilina boulardi TaxID=63433 RepID=UPI0021F54946|nr:uncharacterized protein LOC127277730 [Leptopilina boulardi]
MVELCGGAGMASALDRSSSSRVYYAILAILDSIFSAGVATPAVVGYWRGTWHLSHQYIYGNDIVSSALTSIAIGFIGLFIFNLLQNFLDHFLHPDKHRLCYYFGSRLYTYLFGFCCVNAWRGPWQALDLFTDMSASTVFATTSVSILALAIMRAIRNIAAPPFSLSLDSCVGYFEVPTMFRANNSRDWSLYILDCAFSVIIVGTLVVFVWRGVWVLLDIYLFPDNREQSALGSLIIGYTLVSIAFLLQPVMRYTCARLQGFPKLVLADAFILLSFLATVNVWRGIWNLLDLWLIPENQELSCWITHIGCFIFLVLLNCSNSILVRGVYIDAEEDKGKCVVFPCHYLRLLFKVEREKKEARKQNLIVTTKDFSSHTEPNVKESENGALLNSVVTPMIISGNQDV